MLNRIYFPQVGLSGWKRVEIPQPVKRNLTSRSFCRVSGQGSEVQAASQPPLNPACKM